MHACASGAPLNRLLEKVKDVISGQPQKEKEEKKKEESQVKPPEKEEKDPSKVPHHFGYLANRPKNAPIPEECLICSRMLECFEPS